jgi:Fe-S cluster assembly iron-binding protein IscA
LPARLYEIDTTASIETSHAENLKLLVVSTGCPGTQPSSAGEQPTDQKNKDNPRHKIEASQETVYIRSRQFAALCFW